MSESKKTPNPIWNIFNVCSENLSRAECKLCGKTISVGSDKPKLRTTTNLKGHMKGKHLNKYLELESKKKTIEEEKGESNIFHITNKRARTDMYQSTIPEYVANVETWDFSSDKAQKLHRAVFDMLMVDLEPWNMVNHTGFNRLMKIANPQFELNR